MPAVLAASEKNRLKTPKDRQYNGQKKTDQQTNNTMAKRKQTNRQTIQWPKENRPADKQ